MALVSIFMEMGLPRRKFPTNTTRSMCSAVAQSRTRDPMLFVIVTRVALARSSGLMSSWCGNDNCHDGLACATAVSFSACV